MNEGDTTTTFTYDGDGQRVKKEVDDGETVTITIYVNRYYEKNLTSGEVTTHYYLGGKLVARRQGIDPNYPLNYIHQDSLGSISLMTDEAGDSEGTISYFPFGSARLTSGTIDTDKKFTGQRLDDTGLYYYNARYYDPEIGRFISPDSIVPNPANPQSLNRYSYCLNNPLKYIDPSGHTVEVNDLLSWIAFCQDHPDVALAMGRSDTMIYWGERESSSTIDQALPVERNEPVVVWGYTERGGTYYQYFTSTIVVMNHKGEYYKINTTGHGMGWDVGVSLDILEPGARNRLYTRESWGAQLDVTLIAFADLDLSIMLRIDSSGRYSGNFSEFSHFAFAGPGFSGNIQHTTIEQISASNVFSSMPRWVKDAYNKRYGIRYKSILSGK